jgi:beta-phosphoglucomutase-like phosphatase (HAD superfamily)
VVAVDGILAATLPLRAAALREACEAEGVPCPVERLDLWLAGRSLEEGVAALADLLAAPVDGGAPVVVEPAVQTVLTLRAQRALARHVVHGVLVRPEVVGRLRALVAAGVRVAWRADSERGALGWMDADPALVGVGTMVRAADDRPLAPGRPTLAGSYEAIMARCAAWGVSSGAWWGWELPPVHEALAAAALAIRPFPVPVPARVP